MNAKRVAELFDADAIVGGEPAPLTRSTGYLDILAKGSDSVNVPGGSMTVQELRESSGRPGYGLMTGGSRRSRSRRSRRSTSRRFTSRRFTSRRSTSRRK